MYHLTQMHLGMCREKQRILSEVSEKFLDKLKKNKYIVISRAACQGTQTKNDCNWSPGTPLGEERFWCPGRAQIQSSDFETEEVDIVEEINSIFLILIFVDIMRGTGGRKRSKKSEWWSKWKTLLPFQILTDPSKNLPLRNLLIFPHISIGNVVLILKLL